MECFVIKSDVNDPSFGRIICSRDPLFPELNIIQNNTDDNTEQMIVVTKDMAKQLKSIIDIFLQDK